MVLFLITCVNQLFAAAPATPPADLHIMPPILDAAGRFWVYRNGGDKPRLPFLPYGWMSDASNATSVIKLDLETRNQTNAGTPATNTTETNRCINVSITWTPSVTWAGIAFISGPDSPAWWGDSNRGRYFDLSSLPKKKLVYHVRADRDGGQIKIQLGVLGNRPFGDTLPSPIVGNPVTLTTKWERHEIDLHAVPAAELRRICNGFGVLVELGEQPSETTRTEFYLDDIYFE